MSSAMPTSFSPVMCRFKCVCACAHASVCVYVCVCVCVRERECVCKSVYESKYI